MPSEIAVVCYSMENYSECMSFCFIVWPFFVFNNISIHIWYSNCDSFFCVPIIIFGRLFLLLVLLHSMCVPHSHKNITFLGCILCCRIKWGLINVWHLVEIVCMNYTTDARHHSLKIELRATEKPTKNRKNRATKQWQQQQINSSLCDQPSHSSVSLSVECNFIDVIYSLNSYLQLLL